MDTVQHKFLKVADYSPEELKCFETQFKYGYDIFTDENYVAWLQQYHPDLIPPQDLCENPLSFSHNNSFYESPFNDEFNKHNDQPEDSGNFLMEELELFETWYENGYDIITNEKYVVWLH